MTGPEWVEWGRAPASWAPPTGEYLGRAVALAGGGQVEP